MDQHGHDQLEFPFEEYFQLCSSLERLYAAYAKRHGESAYSLYVLSTLYRAPEGITQTDICSYLGLPKQTVGSIVAKLHARGLVGFRPSPVDGRSKLCALTDEGYRHCQPLADEVAEAETRCSQQIGPERIAAMKETIREFSDLLEREL